MTHVEREVLRTSAYGGPSKLEARQRLWSYADWVRTSGRISWAWPVGGDETVADVGCGNGNDLRALTAEGHRGRLIGVDFSPGMLAEIPGTVARRVVGD